MAVLPPDPVFTLRNIEMGPVHSLCFHLPPDGPEKLLAGTQDGHVLTWDLKTNRRQNKLMVGKSPLLNIHHTSDSLYTQDKGGTISIWTMAEGGYVLHDAMSNEYCGFCRCLISEPHNILIRPQRDSKVEIRTLTGEEIATLVPDSKMRLGEVMCLKLIEFSDNPYLLTAYESGDLFLWDMKAHKVTSQLKLRECPLSVDYDTSTGRGVYGNATEFIQVFNISKTELKMTLKCEIIMKNAGVNVLRIRQDNKVFMSAGWDGRIRVYSWKSLRPLAVLTEHKAALQDLCYSGKPLSLWESPIMAAGGLDCRITLWDIYN